MIIIFNEILNTWEEYSESEYIEYINYTIEAYYRFPDIEKYRKKRKQSSINDLNKKRQKFL